MSVAPDDPAARIVVALDVDELDRAVALARRLSGRVGWLKVGLELFTREGPRAVAAIAEHAPVFLDLKLHDIPTTVARCVASVARLDAGLLTVHASGGPTMLRAAADAAGEASGGRLRLLAVTVLTSTSDDELAAMGSDGAEVQVPRLAAMAIASGIDGLVCAPVDLGRVRAAVGADAVVVTPGIRAQAADSDDHARAMSASAAVRAGADLLVIGRPITRADDPVAAVEAIVATLT
ncbi:MAG: orotidine-5'-phosphate decarboxylase [Actinomycetota bacterium]|nr:orotidine-5'-phosphate decarboxylase [Actinomycetota bacterium]